MCLDGWGWIDTAMVTISSTLCVQAVLLVRWKPAAGWRKGRKTYLARTNLGSVRKEPMCSPYDQVALTLCALK